VAAVASVPRRYRASNRSPGLTACLVSDRGSKVAHIAHLWGWLPAIEFRRQRAGGGAWKLCPDCLRYLTLSHALSLFAEWFWLYVPCAPQQRYLSFQQSSHISFGPWMGLRLGGICRYAPPPPHPSGFRGPLLGHGVGERPQPLAWGLEGSPQCHNGLPTFVCPGPNSLVQPFLPF
jgi:hypothetical protein